MSGKAEAFPPGVITLICTLRVVIEGDSCAIDVAHQLCFGKQTSEVDFKGTHPLTYINLILINIYRTLPFTKIAVLTEGLSITCTVCWEIADRQEAPQGDSLN